MKKSNTTVTSQGTTTTKGIVAYWHSPHVVTIYKDGRPFLTYTGRFVKRALSIPRTTKPPKP